MNFLLSCVINLVVVFVKPNSSCLSTLVRASADFHLQSGSAQVAVQMLEELHRYVCDTQCPVHGHDDYMLERTTHQLLTSSLSLKLSLSNMSLILIQLMTRTWSFVQKSLF